MLKNRNTPLWITLAVVILWSCNTSNKKNTNQSNPIKDPMNQADSAFQANTPNELSQVLFKASGNEPFWNISVKSDEIVFTSLIEGYEEIHTPVPEMIRAADANVKMYRAQTEKVNIDLQIAQGECADTMADIQYPYTVSVSIQLTGDAAPKSLKGCGAYQTDQRLHDIWVLEQIGEDKAEASWFAEKVPEMEINTSDHTLMGYAGCNRMRGTIFWEPGLLRFTNIATTRMACKPENKEGEFLKNLESSTTYRIENNRLWLSNPNGLLLVFRKVD